MARAILLTVLRCYVGDFFSVKNQSPAALKCHQHKSSPTWVTNIDVAEFKIHFI